MSDNIISFTPKQKTNPFCKTVEREIASFRYGHTEMAAYEKINGNGDIEGYFITFDRPSYDKPYEIPFFLYEEFSRSFIRAVKRAFEEEMDKAPVYKQKDVDYSAYGKNIVPLSTVEKDDSINDGIYESLFCFFSSTTNLQVSGKADGSRYRFVYEEKNVQEIPYAFYETLADIKPDFMKAISGFFRQINILN